MKRWDDLTKEEQERAIGQATGQMLQGMCAGNTLRDADVNFIVKKILEEIREGNEPWTAASRIMAEPVVVKYIRDTAEKEAASAFFAEGSELVLYIL